MPSPLPLAVCPCPRLCVLRVQGTLALFLPSSSGGLHYLVSVPKWETRDTAQRYTPLLPSATTHANRTVSAEPPIRARFRGAEGPAYTPAPLPHLPPSRNPFPESSARKLWAQGGHHGSSPPPVVVQESTCRAKSMDWGRLVRRLALHYSTFT